MTFRMIFRQFRRSALVGLVLMAAIPAVSSAKTEVQKVTSKSGIVAWLVEDHTNPIISLSFAFYAGGVRDPVGREGLAKLTTIMLDEGAGEMKALAFQRKLEDLSISLSFEAGRDQFRGSLRTLRRNGDEAFGMVGLALTRPRFDSDALERMRAGMLNDYLRNSRRPNYLARRAFWSAAYPDHPYGRPVAGTADSLRAISAADLRNFVKDNLTQDNLVIGVVGDVTPAQLAGLLEKAFASLPAKQKKWALPAVMPRLQGGVVVQKFKTPQSVVIFGQPGIARRNPDYYSAHVLNHILGGGGFTSRLYGEVREKRGLAYSVYSYLWPMQRSALYLGAVATQNKRVAESIKVIKQEWARIAKDGPTAQELASAKKFLTGSYPLRFSSSTGIAEMLVGLQLEGLEADYFEKRNSYIQSVTLDDARLVARRLLQPDKLTFFVVGDPTGL